VKAKLLPLWCFESLSKLCECEPKSELWTKARSLFLSSNCENLDWLYQGHVWLGKNYTRDGLSSLFFYDGPEPNQPTCVKIRGKNWNAFRASVVSFESRLLYQTPISSLPFSLSLSYSKELFNFSLIMIKFLCTSVAVIICCNSIWSS
jgi:hypothetical protein